jgi:prepilin-type N-terminal cleavage/methylation domain-containing protein
MKQTLAQPGRFSDGGSHCAAPRPRLGFTLAELLVSLLVVAVVLTAIASVLVLTSHAVGLSAAQAGEVRVDDVVSSIASEQRLASKVIERTTRSIAFLVDPDRDGIFDTIRYAWSGVPGDPLTRQVNGATPTILVRDVQRFNLSYVLKTTPVAAPPPDVEVGSDVLLYAHTTGSSAQSVSSMNWVAQYFKPDWNSVAPGKTVTAWRITKVEFVASKAPTGTGSTPWVVRVFSAGPDLKPVLAEKRDEATLAISLLPSTTTPTNFLTGGVFAGNAGLDPAKGMCITVGPQPFSPSGFVGYDASSSDAAGAWMTSSTGGTLYTTPSTTKDMRVKVWGRYKYPG